jgi:glycosyltransferase involved in cell wall biosynthesis
MRLGIDASNIRGSGGAVTHLKELLRVAIPSHCGFSDVIVWGSAATLKQLDERDWLHKVNVRLLDGPLPFRAYWQMYIRDKIARASHCDLLFMPQGVRLGSFRPTVAMSQNLLPFEWSEAWRYGISWQLLRLLILRRAQSECLRSADGVVFLTEYARHRVLNVLKDARGKSAVIPHGINRQFFCPPRNQRAISEYSDQNPFRILYISTIDVYKHQWHVVRAVRILRKLGIPLRLDLIGSAYPAALERLTAILREDNDSNSWVTYRGFVAYSDLPCEYRTADLFVFASSCENMPNILLEAMASGLPIACSNRGPMSEILRDSGLFFDPESPASISGVIKNLLDSPELRQKVAKSAFDRSHMYSWEKCASEMLEFFASMSKA